MCNLGEGIYENGVKDGEERGKLLKQIEIIRNNVIKGTSLDVLAEIVGVDVELVRKIADIVAENANVTDAELVERYCKKDI